MVIGIMVKHFRQKPAIVIPPDGGELQKITRKRVSGKAFQVNTSNCISVASKSNHLF